ncbi:MAG: aminotransferase class III-fold pyridoxal phosphate-dependent enzyme [Gemmatimonadales bacterium]
MTVAGFTSTGSKRPAALFGDTDERLESRLESCDGCTIRTADGREYLDFMMSLGAMSLGYNHRDVRQAAIEALERGVVGSLSPTDEEALASELAAVIPWCESVRFLKTGAEAVAAAVRIARTATGRDLVLGCGYHGWLDWCSAEPGVPTAVTRLYATIPFNNTDRTRDAIRAAGTRLACVVIEPVIDGPPDAEWLALLRDECTGTGALLIFDEVKTAFRLATGGAAERWGVRPDLMVLGKAMASGFPLAAVGGPAHFMKAVERTWISSTAATEFVSFAAARATVAAFGRERVAGHLERIGNRLLEGLQRIVVDNPRLGIDAAGLPQMCYLRYADESLGQRVAVACADRGLLFKRNAYNFVSLAHDDAAIDRALAILGEILASC